MQLNPYLIFNGQCEEAFKFYEKCLGGKIEAIFHVWRFPHGRTGASRMGKQSHARAHEH